MPKTFRYTTVDDQIQKLKSQGLLFENQEQAKEILTIYGTFNVINSYREMYLIVENGAKKYKEGITFERLFSLYTFDHYLKASMVTAMLDVEEMLRACLAEVISASFGVNHNVYLCDSHYANVPEEDEFFSLDELLQKARREIRRADTLPLTHYRDNYNIVPPWILFRELSFFQLVNFVRQLKTDEKSKLVQLLYGVDENTAKKTFMHNLMEDTLAICREYRNRAAHSARIFDFQLTHSIQIPDDSELDYLQEIYPFIYALKANREKGIALLITLLQMLAYEQPYRLVNDQMCEQIKRHCERYIEDAPFLEQIIGGEIRIERIE